MLQFRLDKARELLHILTGYLKALDNLDEVIALIRRSPTADAAREALIELLDIDAEQANAILSLQLRRLAAMERQKILDDYAKAEAEVIDYEDILARPERQRSIVSEELTEITDKHGDDRRTKILPFDGEMSVEDLIPEEDVVVTITRGGFAKRTKVSEYRAQHRGGKGIRGASLRGDDVVDRFAVASTHDWHLFFTNLGRVYRTKGYELPEGGRDSKGQHVANLLAFQPGENIVSAISFPSYQDAEYLVLATADGLVKKTRLTDYDSPRTGGLIAIKLREHVDGSTDQVVAARLVNEGDDILLVSKKGQSLRFTATDETLRPMGRATSGVTGMKFRDDDSLLSMDIVRDDSEVFVVTEGGFAKRTSVSQYRRQGRGGLGIKVANLVEERGDLVGALITEPTDEVLVIMSSGKIVRSAVSEVSLTGRNTQGVMFARPDSTDRIVAIAGNVEAEEELVEAETPPTGETPEGENGEVLPGDENPVTSTEAEDAGDVVSTLDQSTDEDIESMSEQTSQQQSSQVAGQHQSPAPEQRTPQATTKPSGRGIRRAHMTISRIDPWSALKISFLLAVGMGVMIVISSVVLWNVLDSMNVFASIRDLLETLGSEPLLELMQYLEFGRVVSFSIIVAVIDVVLFTLLGGIIALLYNLTSMLVGGVHITITDE